MRLPVVHLERTVNGQREKRTVNTTAYARDIAKWHRKGFKLAGEYTPPETPDATVDFARRQDEKELARAANPNHEASNDAERQYEHRQGRPVVTVKRKPGRPKKKDSAP